MKRILCLVALLAGCNGQEPVESAENYVRQAKIITVTRTTALATHEFSARTEALQSVDVSFEVAGPLAELPIKEGEVVPKGSLVAALDPTVFELAVREAEVQRQLAAQDLRRKQGVFERRAIARSEVDDARSHHALQQVRLSKAAEQLRDSRIYAPFDAYVSRRYFDRHVNVQPGQPVARLLDLTRLRVVFNAPEHLLATYTQDQLKGAWAEFPFAQDRRFPLTFHENLGEADALAQTFEVTFTMENPADWNPLPGMTATVHLQLEGESGGRVLVPASAIVPGPDGSLLVWVFDAESQTVNAREVVVDAPRANGVPVLSGLEPGEQIVAAGASQLHRGMKVRPF